MSREQLVEDFESTYLKKNIPNFKVGDTVKVSIKIVEGKKERIQVFTGIVISRKGVGISQAFTVYRNAYGSCMERTFLIHSPMVADIEVVRLGDVRRSKLYYLIGATGKKARVKEKILVKAKKSKKQKASVTEEKVISEEPKQEENSDKE